MPDIQIAVDCADPHPLARFWAGVLDMQVEDHHEQIEKLIADGYATEDDTVTVDGRRAWKTGAACRDLQGRLPRLLFQTVPEPKTVKNRVHLDVHVGPDHREAKVAELEAAGATRLWDGQQGPHTWVTMADPEGNEFCVS